MKSESEDVYVGFGLGPIQGGLFLYEANRANPNRKLVVAEIDAVIVSAVQHNHNCCDVNIAYPDRLEVVRLAPIEIKKPEFDSDCEFLVEAIARATEIGTAVPSVDYYASDRAGSLNRVLAAGIQRKLACGGPPAVIYTAENHNRAAEILESHVMAFISEEKRAAARARVQFINTVIGKMSRVVTHEKDIREWGLSPMAPSLPRALLVESFNKILISRISLNQPFRRGIQIFEEKDDLLPFAEAKLYGHNATHALLGYLGVHLGAQYMSDLKCASGVIPFARKAFLEESGAALIRKHEGHDLLFTQKGYQEYADDLIRRMVNPYLRDTIDRVTRDSERKLGWDDRLIGTMRIVLEQSIVPHRYALQRLRVWRN